MPNITWFISVFVLLFVGWLIFIGPQEISTQKPFLEPPSPLGSGKTYGPNSLVSNFENTNTKTTGIEEVGEGTPATDPLFGGQVSLVLGSSGNSANPNVEYVGVIASPNNTHPINITGWRPKSAITGGETSIGQGTTLSYWGKVNFEQPIFLNPGERAIIVTGRSPVGVSFKLNSCTGFLEQFQNFAPKLPLQCPHPLEENYPTGLNGLNDACVDYLKSFPRCAAHIKAIPVQFGGVCQDFIQTITYTGCLERHKNDSDFYKPEWRVFLKRDEELWKDRRETIRSEEHTSE